MSNYVLVKRNGGEPRTQAYYAETKKEAGDRMFELERGGKAEYRMYQIVGLDEALAEKEKRAAFRKNARALSQAWPGWRKESKRVAKWVNTLRGKNYERMLALFLTPGHAKDAVARNIRLLNAYTKATRKLA